MTDLILFIALVVVIFAHALYLSLVLRTKPRQWVTSTLGLLAMTVLLPPAGFSSVMIMVVAMASCASHWWVLRQTRPALLKVRKAGSEAPDPDRKEIMPFPAMQSGQPANDYEGLGKEDSDDDAAYDRVAHPTKKAGSKRAKKKRKKASAGRQAVSTADIPTADKPTIEEYLRPRDDFFNDK
jgi:hypothetical protein